MTRVRALMSVVVLLTPAIARAQSEVVVSTPPPNLVVGNYNSASVGPYGGLEGTAYVARINDPSATWFNPAGLARKVTAQISGSAGVYQTTTVSPRALPNQGGSIQQLPNFVGFTFVVRQGWTVGASVLSTNTWDQETDSELITPAGAGQRRFAYSADSGFEQRVAAIGVGYHRDGPWRFGGGFAFSLEDVRLVQSASDRVADAGGLQSLLVSARVSGSTIQLRTQGGAQYDRGSWMFGAAVRTPGAVIHRSGSVIFDGVMANDPGSLGTSLFDPDAHHEFHLPWEFQVGAAYVRTRFEVELDVHAYTSIDAYSLISTGQPLLVYRDQGAGVPPLVTSRDFQGLTSASESVVNVGAGGHYRLWKDRDFLIHAGIGSNQSPVAPPDRVFNKVDLTTWSAGVSGTIGKFQFAVGINRQTGSADDVTLRNLLNGQVVQTPVDFRITGLIYSLAYQF